MVSRRKVLGGTAAAALGAVGLAACSSDSGPTPEEANDPVALDEVLPRHIPVEGVTPDLEGDAELGIPAAYFSYPDPPIEMGLLPVPPIDQPVSWLWQGNPPPVPLERNQRYQQLREDTGAEWDFIFGSNANAYTEKLQATIASGDLPDLLMLSGVPRIPDLLEAEFTDLTPFLAGDAVADYPGLASIPTTAWTVPRVNGRLWGLPQARIPVGRSMQTNGKVLAELGMDRMHRPSNGEEFLDLLREVTDPAANRFALAGLPYGWLTPLINEMMGGVNVWRAEEDGSFVSQYETEEWTNALEVTVQVWSEGLYHPNTFAQPGNNGVWFNSGVTPFLIQGFLAETQDAAYNKGVVVAPAWEGGGLPAKHTYPPAYNAFVAISKQDSDDRVRELLRIADFLSAPFGTQEFLRANYGVEGVHYDLEEYGPVTRPDMIEQEPAMTFYIGSQTSITYAGAEERTRERAEVTREVMTEQEPNASQGLFTDVETGAATLAIQDAMGEIIQGRLSMSDWPAAVQTWLDDAGNEWREALQEAYAVANG